MSYPESWLQRGHMELQHNPKGSPDNAFGVRVQVQEIKGHPYVVLNSGGQDSHRDVSVKTHQTENDLAGLRASSPRRCVDKRPLSSSGYFGDTPYEFWDSVRPEVTPKLHYQRHPELLRPYDPENNNLNLLVLSQAASVGRQSQLHAGGLPETTPAVKAAKARIPLPAEGHEEDVSKAQSKAQSKALTLDREIPSRFQNALQTQTVSSVGKLIDQFDSIQRSGRRGPRNRIDPEERKRSRSVDANRPPASTSPSSSAASYLKTNTGGTQSGVSAPGSPKSWLFSGKHTLASRREESASTSRPRMELASPHAAKAPHRVEGSCTSHLTPNHTGESDEREAQVTPDLLKGQQELSADSNEDTAKQILFFYLKDGTTDNDTIIEKKVKQVFDTMNKLKLRTAEDLKEEKDYTAEARCLEDKQAELKEEMSKLKKQLEVEIKNEKTLAKACEKARTEKKTLQEELVQSKSELSKLRDSLTELEGELQSTKQELVRLKAERDRSKTEMKDLQQQLSEMHDELDHAKSIKVVNTEKEVLLKEMSKLRSHFEEVLQAQEEQEEVLHQRERELNALKGAIKEEVAVHDKLVASLKEEYKQEVENLQRAVEQAKETNAQLGQEKMQAEEQRSYTKVEVRELSQEKERLKEQVLELENKVDQLNNMIQESKALEKLLEHRVHQLEREKQRVEESLINVRKKEDEMCHSNKSLLVNLEDVQGKLTKLNHEHRDLKDKLKEERRQTEEIWKTKRELEEEKRHQDRMVEQLQRKMNNIMEECETATDTLQNQVDEARERSEREQCELRRQLQERGVELEKSQHAVKKLQEELLPLEEDLRRCRRELQEAHLRGRQLEQKVGELEERNTATVGDRERQVKLMEGRIIQLEEDLREERNTADCLMERVDKTKEQMDHMRNELLQERSVRQDLECDKISLERQNKDLKSKVSHLEGSQRNNQDSLVSKLNSRIQELEDRLQGEERENNNLQQSNRKLERKVKEVKMQVDEDKITLQSHTDQLLQRLKTAKRQMDEAEEEIERLEHAKKKLQRELDEQVEINEQTQDQLNALRNEMRHMKKSKPLLKIVEDDADELGSD